MAPQATFTVLVPANADTLVVTVEIPAYAAAPGGTSVAASFGSGAPQRVCCLGVGVHQAAFRLPSVSRADRVVTAHLTPSTHFVPAQRGINGDRRTLTVLLRAVTVVNTLTGQRYIDGAEVDVLGHSIVWDRIDLGLLVVCGIGILALALRRRLAFIWVAVLITDPFALAIPAGQTTVTLTKVVLFAALLVLIARQIFTRRSTPSWNWRTATVSGAFALFILSMVLSALHARYAWPAWRETGKAAEYFLTVGVAFFAYRADPDRELLRRVLAILTVAVSALALGQLWFGTSESFAIGSHVVPRVAGPLEGPNQLGAFLGIVLPLVLALALGNQSGPRVRLRADELAALLLGGAALLLTFSRGGIVSCLFGFVLVVLLRTGRRAAVTIAAVVFCVVAGSVAVQGTVRGDTTFAKIFPTRGSDLYNGGLGTRQELWSGALRMWRRHPLLGVGPGNYELEIAAYAPGVRTSANDYYLQVLSEQGAVGFLAFLLLVAATVRVLYNVRDPLAIGMLAVVLAFAFHQIVDSLLLYPKVGDMYWALLAIAGATAAATVRPSPRESAILPP